MNKFNEIFFYKVKELISFCKKKRFQLTDLRKKGKKIIDSCCEKLRKKCNIIPTRHKQICVI